MLIRATRDFYVGSKPQVLVIAKGSTRSVNPDVNGSFRTITKDGNWFGMCNIKDGWEEVK